jgi:hypothetical protein
MVAQMTSVNAELYHREFDPVVDQEQLEAAYYDGMTARLHANPLYRRPDEHGPRLLQQAWLNGWNYGDEFSNDGSNK